MISFVRGELRTFTQHNVLLPTDPLFPLFAVFYTKIISATFLTVRPILDLYFWKFGQHAAFFFDYEGAGQLRSRS